jgi:competence protein ComEC
MLNRRWLLRASGTTLLLLIFLAGLIAGILYRRHRPTPRVRYLMAAFLDVGAGDCVLIRTPQGQAILVDTGPQASGSVITQTLQQQGIRTLDLLVLTSDTPGSVGGLGSLLDKDVPIAQIWMSPSVAKDSRVQAMLKARPIPMRVAQAGDVRAIDGATLTALLPLKSESPTTTAAAMPLICRLDYGNTGFLLLGSANASACRRLLADGGSELDCDVLEAPDGGADGATTPELLRRATPSIAVISCAHLQAPGSLTLHWLDAADAVVWRTDLQGAVTVFTDGSAEPLVTAAHQ